MVRMQNVNHVIQVSFQVRRITVVNHVVCAITLSVILHVKSQPMSFVGSVDQGNFSKFSLQATIKKCMELHREAILQWLALVLLHKSHILF